MSPRPNTDASPRLEPGSLEDATAFLRAAGFVVDEAGATRVLGHIDLGADHHTPWGIVHGGVYTSAVESASSIGASLAVRDDGKVAVGLTNVTHFLRPMTSGRVRLDAVPLTQGRTHQLWRVDITDEHRRLVAHGEVRLQNVEGHWYRYGFEAARAAHGSRLIGIPGDDRSRHDSR